MAVYRNDTDLNLLGQCSNEELQLLVSILTTDTAREAVTLLVTALITALMAQILKILDTQ